MVPGPAVVIRFEDVPVLRVDPLDHRVRPGLRAEGVQLVIFRIRIQDKMLTFPGIDVDVGRAHRRPGRVHAHGVRPVGHVEPPRAGSGGAPCFQIIDTPAHQPRFQEKPPVRIVRVLIRRLGDLVPFPVVQHGGRILPIVHGAEQVITGDLRQDLQIHLLPGLADIHISR